MSIAVGQSSAAKAQGVNGRQSNFGSLVSAINRGDVAGAQNAFAALSELGPKAPGPLRKGALDAMEKALEDADLAEAKKALKALQQSQLAQSCDAPTSVPVPTAGLASGSTINILI
jgi:hypothetical protein